MLAPAPVTFSTITFWPSEVRMRSERMRASVSVGPPAGNGTMMVTGREGEACPCAPATHARVTASAVARVVSFMRSSKSFPLKSLRRRYTRSDRGQGQHPCHSDVIGAELAGTSTLTHRCRMHTLWLCRDGDWQ